MNEQYAEAEERFQRALDKDSTDYQALLNLAFIEIHKGDAPRAFKYFHDALVLPGDLGDAATARSLWATARLHYAETEYPQALDLANRALALEKTPTGDALFTTGVYAALAGDRDLCLKRTRAAVETDPGLFAKVAVAPNLGKMRADVLRLLSEMASAALADATRAVAENRKALAAVTKGKHASTYQDLLLTVRRKIDQTEKLLETPFYAGCLSATTALGEVSAEIAQLAALKRLVEDWAQARQEVIENQQRHRESEQRHREVVQQCGEIVEEAEEAAVRRSGLGSLFDFLIDFLIRPQRAFERARQEDAAKLHAKLQRYNAKREQIAESEAKLRESETKLRESRAAFDVVQQRTRGLRDQIAQRLSKFTPSTTAAAPPTSTGFDVNDRRIPDVFRR